MPVDDEPQQGARVLERVREVLQRAGPARRPRVTLTYAQSVDGCISTSRDVRTAISNPDCQVFTHRLRALHDAIVVGINTVLVDDPQLTVRHVAGNDPVPVILDSRLRTPPCAAVLQQPTTTAVIATTDAGPRDRSRALAQAGAEVVRLSANRQGRVDLDDVLAHLRAMGIRSVMIEGGATVITSVFLAGVADQVVLTVAPRVLGGVHAVGSMSDVAPERRPVLDHITYEAIAGDLVLHGELAGAR